MILLLVLVLLMSKSLSENYSRIVQESNVSVPTNRSFTNTTTFPLLIKSLRISFIIAWNMADELVIPKNITVGSKKPTCIVNALFYLSPSLILTLLNLYLRSILVDTFLPPILLINSVVRKLNSKLE